MPLSGDNPAVKACIHQQTVDHCGKTCSGGFTGNQAVSGEQMTVLLGAGAEQACLEFRRVMDIVAGIRI